MSAIHKVGEAIGRESKIASMRLSTARRSRQSGQRGATLLEFALIMVIVLALIFGIIDFGRALYSYHFVAEVAREATRFASVRGATSCGTSVTPCAVVQTDVQNFVNQIVPQGIGPNPVNATLNYLNPSNLPICNSTPNYPGCTVQVTVNFQFNFAFPPGFYSLSPNIQMSNTSNMVISR